MILITIIVLTARFGNAKENLTEDPNYKFRIYFTKRNGKNNINGESYYTNKINLKDGLMYYKNEIIQLYLYVYIINYSDNIDRNKDSIEIAFALFNEKNKKYKPLVIRVRDLTIGNDKEDLWAIPEQNLINVSYTLMENTDIVEPQKPPMVFDGSSIRSHAISNFKKKELQLEIGNNDDKKNNNNYKIYYSPETQPRSSSLITKTKSLFKNILSSKSKKPEEVNSTTPTAPNSLTISQNYEIVEYQEITFPNNNSKAIKEAVSFCEGIFISGLKKDNSTLIEKSELFQAPCCHHECSLLPSYQPQILNIYKANRKNVFEISDSVTDMCFPLGIKLCYKCKCDKSFSNNIKDAPIPYNSFMNIILNEKGKRYIVTMVYFKKIKVKDFEKEYKLFPIKEYFKLNQTTELGSVSDKDLQNAFSIMTEFVSQDTLLIPEAITLISKFPFINQMTQCLKSMIGLPIEEMNSLISYLSNDVPVPLINQSVWFYLPKEPQPIQLYSPANFIQESLIQTKNIFNYLSVKNIIFIFHLMLLEQKILFIDNDYKVLSELSFIFISLLYPLDWVNTYIPVLSLSTVEFLQSFIPFIMGIDEYLLSYSTQKGYITQSESDGIVYVSISKNLISTSLPKKRDSKKTLMKDLNIPDLPEKINKKLYKELKEIKLKMKKGENVERMMKDAFIKAIIMLINNYKSFTYYPNEGVPLVNKEQFCSFPNEKDHRVFANEILASQNYNQFLLNEKESGGKMKGLTQQLVHDVIYIDYFNKMYSTYCKPFKVKKEKNNQLKSNKKKNLKGKHVSYLTTILEETSSENSSNSDNTPIQEKEYKDASEFKTYLLAPYFIKNPLLSTEKSKIEEWIKSNKQKNAMEKECNVNVKQCLQIKDCFILDSSITNYEFQGINEIKTYYKYLFPEDIHLKEVNQFTIEENINLNNNETIKAFVILNNTKLSLNEEEQNILYECFKSICINNKLLLVENKPKIISLIRKISGVDYLISLLLPENRYLKILEQKTIKEENFEDLILIIRTAFNALREMNYIQGRQLTLITLSYYKLITSKERKGLLYLYEGLINDKYKSPLWLDDHFWMALIKEEYNHSDNNQSNGNTVNSEEEIGESYIMAVYSLMHYLKLSKTLIKKSLLFPTASKYLNTETRIILERKINDDE